MGLAVWHNDPVHREGLFVLLPIRIRHDRPDVVQAVVDLVLTVLGGAPEGLALARVLASWEKEYQRAGHQYVPCAVDVGIVQVGLDEGEQGLEIEVGMG